MSGIVRPSRRPLGWTAPGPPPAPPIDTTALGPHDGEDLCYLAGDWRILQRIDGHRWSLDDLATAWCAADAVAATPPQHHLDLGCGIGTVLLLLAWRFPSLAGQGIEAQPLSVDLARRSLGWNGIADRCAVSEGDLRDPHLLPPAARFDLITGTPPYFALGHATASARPQCTPAHFELRGGITDYCTAAARWLSAQGTFVACAANSQRPQVEAAAAHAGFHIVDRLDVIPRAGKPCLFSAYTMRRHPAPTPRTRTLEVRDARGERTSACHAMRGAMGLPP